MWPGDKAGRGLGTRLGGAWGQGWAGLGDKAGWGLGTRLGGAWGQGWAGLGDKARRGLGTRLDFLCLGTEATMSE